MKPGSAYWPLASMVTSASAGGLPPMERIVPSSTTMVLSPENSIRGVSKTWAFLMTRRMRSSPGWRRDTSADPRKKKGGGMKRPPPIRRKQCSILDRRANEEGPPQRVVGAREGVVVAGTGGKDGRAEGRRQSAEDVVDACVQFDAQI